MSERVDFGRSLNLGYLATPDFSGKSSIPRKLHILLCTSDRSYCGRVIRADVMTSWLHDDKLCHVCRKAYERTQPTAVKQYVVMRWVPYDSGDLIGVADSPEAAQQLVVEEWKHFSPGSFNIGEWQEYEPNPGHPYRSWTVWIEGSDHQYEIAELEVNRLATRAS